MLKKIFTKILAPVSASEDTRRQEFILNILLAFSIIFVAVAFFRVLHDQMLVRHDLNHSVMIVFGVLCFFLLLLWLSRRGWIKIASFALIGMYFLDATFTVAWWGVDLPEALLLYFFIIIIAGILINVRFSVFLALVIFALLVLFTKWQQSGIIVPDRSWRDVVPEVKDTIALGVLFFSGAILSWLSNREMEKSLQRARASERALQRERDSLEIRVEERTRELKQAQLEKMNEVNRLAEFGRLSSGLFHDLANPLTAVALSLEKLSGDDRAKFGEARDYLAKAYTASKRMQSFIHAVKKQYSAQEEFKVFSLNEEIEDCLQILAYKARKMKVELIFDSEKNFVYYGDQLKFGQIVTNLVSNAIDAYAGLEPPLRPIVVSLSVSGSQMIFSVKDGGSGMSPEVAAKIFEPLFTTKRVGEGSGIGLVTVKQIVERDLAGALTFTSVPGQGSEFSVTFKAYKNQ